MKTMYWIVSSFLLLLLVIGSCEPKKSDVKVKKDKNLIQHQSVSTRRCPNSYICINKRCHIRSHMHMGRTNPRRPKTRHVVSITCGTRNVVVV